MILALRVDHYRDQVTLHLEDVCFTYRRGFRTNLVFDKLTWAVPEGRRTLLLGPNGAGKSTLFSLIAGQQRPQSGSIRDSELGLGARPSNGVAWMPQHISPIRGLTVWEQVAYAGWLAGRSKGDAESNADHLLELTHLSELRDRRSSELSGGQLRRLGLAQALTREHRVLLLDEPTAGLDPAQARNFRSLLDHLPRRAGIVVSTHQVSELDNHFDHVTVLSGGKVAFDGSVAQFRAFGEELGLPNADVTGVFSALTDGGWE